jgi:MFS family permease
VTVVAALCAAEILSTVTFAMFPALQPMLRAEWNLSNTAAGWISGIYYAGYMLAVPILTGLTDHVDARRVWLGSAALTLVAAVAFSTIAAGMWTAIACQFLAGIGLAGTYMPGLKLLADATEGGRQARFISLYTTSFTVGTSVSFYVVGALTAAVDWRVAVLVAAAGPALAIVVVAGIVPAHAARGFDWRALWALDFKPVVRSSRSMRIVFTYAAHMWELFAFRAWLVPFLTFTDALHGVAGGIRPTTVAAVVSLIGVPSSIVGNELGARFGRARVITVVMASAIGMSVLVGLSSQLSWAVVVLACGLYGLLVTADSAALTSGVIASAPAQVRGATMAVHSMIGFAGAFAGSLVVGGVLDAFGGQSVFSWTLAFVAMALPGAAGILLMRGQRASLEWRT